MAPPPTRCCRVLAPRAACCSHACRACCWLPRLQCNIVEHRNFKVVYRRYASLFFLMGIDAEEVGAWPPAAPAVCAATASNPAAQPACCCCSPGPPTPAPRPPACPPPPSLQNELGTLEMIHCMVETLDKWFSNVCELDIMFSLDTTHHIIDEMVANGCVVETNKANALMPVQLLERLA